MPFYESTFTNLYIGPSTETIENAFSKAVYYLKCLQKHIGFM